MRFFIFMLLAVAAAAGCAQWRESGRHLSRPFTGENYPEKVPMQIAVAPVAGVTLLADALVVHPVWVMPKAMWKAHKLTSLALAAPKNALYIALPDIIAYPLYLPFWAVGTVVTFIPMELYYAVVPGASD
jgi:hypothetical protein